MIDHCCSLHNSNAVYRTPARTSCFGRCVERIASTARRFFYWLGCKLASCLGVIANGNVSNKQLAHKLKANRLSLQARSLLERSLKGLTRVIDSHLHILGYDKGNYLSPGLNRGFSGMKWAVIHCAATGTSQQAGSTDLAVERLQLYAQHFDKLQGMILPIHPALTESGKIDYAHTGSSLCNRVAVAAAKTFKGSRSRLLPAVSIHPGCPTWEKQLVEAHAKGIRMLKWMPPQGINPSDPRWDDFYKKLASLGIVLIAHSGPEHAVPGPAKWQDYGNPRFFERPLQLGVNLILAHSGHKEKWQNFLALAEEAQKQNWPGKLYGDLAGMLHYGADFVENLVKISQRPGVRILYGSDYPYTNLIPPRKDPLKILAARGLLDQRFVAPLQEIRSLNPLLGNFVAVRQIKLQGLSFPDETFTGDFADGSIKLMDESAWQAYLKSAIAD